MSALDIVQLLLILPVALVSFLYPEKLNIKFSIFLISPVVIFTLLFLIKYQIPDLVFIPLGLLIGIISFVLSIWVTEENKLSNVLRDYYKNILAIFRVDFRAFQDWDSVLFISLMVVYEEIVWRVFLVETLSPYINQYGVILIASFLFYYSHSNQRNLSRQSIDLLIFSLMLTAIYYYSRTFALVLFIHWIRNMIIVTNSIGAAETEKHLAVADK